MLSRLSWRRGRSRGRESGSAASEGLPHDDPDRTVQERNLRALLVIAATNNTAWDLVTPFIPLFILSLVEGDPVAAAAWSGIALGISPLMTAVAGPFWGAFAQRYGARSAMLRTLLIAPCLVVLLAVTTAIWQVLILRFLIGVFGGFYVLVHALAAQTAPRDRVGQAIGTLQATSMICLAIIPPIAGLLTDIWGLRSNFVLAAAIMLISLAVMWRGYTPESGGAGVAAGGAGSPGSAEERTAHKQSESYWSLLRRPEMALVATIVFVGQYVERTFWPLAPLLVVEMEPASEQLGLMTGLVLGIGSGATALSALLVGRLARRVPARSLLLASLAFGCVTLPVLVLMETFWQFVAARVVMGLLTGGIVTLAYAHVSTVLPSDRLSVSFGMFASVAMVASAVGPVSLSTLATTAGLRSPLIAGAVGFACCFLLLLIASRQPAVAGATPRQVGLPGGSG
jgi:DHA1 family multidrug resistance protein-like MFS transporter